MTSSLKFFWKFDKSRDLIQSKLSYDDKELQSDLEGIFKSNVKHLVKAFLEYRAMDIDTSEIMWSPLQVMVP